VVAVRVREVVGDLDGKTAIIIDDMISTGGTLVKASEAILGRGATSVITCATHGIFAAGAAQKLNDSPISEIVVTNTVPVPQEIRGSKIKVLSVAPLLADTIRRISSNRSVSEIYVEQEDSLGGASEEAPLFKSVVPPEGVEALQCKRSCAKAQSAHLAKTEPPVARRFPLSRPALRPGSDHPQLSGFAASIRSGLGAGGAKKVATATGNHVGRSFVASFSHDIVLLGE